jgi:predicted nucleic acid-binding protein
LLPRIREVRNNPAEYDAAYITLAEAVEVPQNACAP